MEEILEEMRASFGEEDAKDSNDAEDSNDAKKGYGHNEDMEYAPERLRLFLLHLKQNEMISLER